MFRTNITGLDFLQKKNFVTTNVSLRADVRWGSVVTHSFLPRGGEMNASQPNPNGRLRGGYTNVDRSQ